MTRMKPGEATVMRGQCGEGQGDLSGRTQRRSSQGVHCGVRLSVMAESQPTWCPAGTYLVDIFE